MRFGFNFGYLGSFAGGAGEKACIENAQTDTTWNGHIAGTGSTMKPSDTESGLVAYECKWDALDVNGNVVFSLGVAGDEQEPNTHDIAIGKDGKAVVLIWDDTAKVYSGSDLEFTTYLNTLFVVGEELCITIGYLPVLLIHYDFTSIDIGSKI